MNKFQRKLNKLKREPKLFISDMVNKHANRLKKHLPIKYEGHNQYTVISAVYNVGRYLDDYFSSLTQQTLDFKKHIQLILVDDGSTDNSAEIIKNWQKKYPKNIHYIHKENGGQASARNLGLEFVKTEWVTFIDPDDFLSKEYFQYVDDCIFNNINIELVSCSFIFYFEDKKIFNDSHPLKYRFNDKTTILQLNEMKEHFQMSVNSAFFKFQTIKDNNILFPEIKPNFEDAKFVGDYLTKINQNNSIAFLKQSKYFYRKRSDNSSTLDTSWSKNTLFTQVLDQGCLELLQNAKNELGYIPIYIQNAVLYHLSWYFKYIINNNQALSILSENEKASFISLLHKIFSLIEVNTIMQFNLVGTWFFQRVAWLGYFKNTKPAFQIVYIDNIDKNKQQFLLYYFTCDKNPKEDITLAGKKIKPIYEKTVVYEFAGDELVYERRLWLPYNETMPKQMFRFKIDGQQARISLIGKQHLDGLPIRCLLRDFTPKNYTNIDSSWILMDRDIQADDNAEHLYRYIMKNHPEQKIYFALSKKSHDWNRLKKEGFNLLDFNSKKYKEQLKKSSRLISSHIDEYIVNPFKDNFEFSKKIVFLQHGVTHNDLSSWLNSKRTLQCLITTTPDEYQAISGNYTKYRFTKKEVVLTGFPRHDSLLLGNKMDSKIILIMPTWRKSILGSATFGTNNREFNKNFMDTLYAKSWGSFLCSPELQYLAKQFGYEVIFAPHANIQPYLNVFKLPKYIKIWKSSDCSIQELFQKSTLMITDYSSVAFEMAFLNKMVLYYQFDKDDFFSKGHVFKQDYFSYEKNGFGPVVYNENDLINSLDAVLKNEGKPFFPYNERISQTFPFRDGKNCERVYNAIIELENTMLNEYISLDDLILSLQDKFKSFWFVEKIATYKNVAFIEIKTNNLNFALECKINLDTEIVFRNEETLKNFTVFFKFPFTQGIKLIQNKIITNSQLFSKRDIKKEYYLDIIEEIILNALNLEIQLNLETQAAIKQVNELNKQLIYNNVLNDMAMFFSPKHLSMLDTLKKVKEDNLSIARFGDGEIKLMVTKQNISFQSYNWKLMNELREVSNNKNELLVCYPDAMIENPFWIEYWSKNWFKCKYYLKRDFYGNSFITRPEIFHIYGNQAVELWKSIWNNKKVCFITGEGSRMNANHVIFNNVKEANHIYSKAKNAYDDIDHIMEKCKKIHDIDMFLIALGPTGTVLAARLYYAGFRALDIGHLNNSYDTAFNNLPSPEQQ